MPPQKTPTKWSVTIHVLTSGVREPPCPRGDTAQGWRWWGARSTCVGARKDGTGKMALYRHTCNQPGETMITCARFVKFVSIML